MQNLSADRTQSVEYKDRTLCAERSIGNVTEFVNFMKDDDCKDRAETVAQCHLQIVNYLPLIL